MDLPFCTRVCHPRKEGDGWHSFSASLGWISGILHWFKELCGSFDSRVEALENQEQAHMALLEAKKIASQYQKEVDKCSSGMETCEEAREKGRDENIVVGASYLFRVWVAQRPPGYAFVDFDDSRDAKDAIRELDGSQSRKWPSVSNYRAKVHAQSAKQI
ncbi:hypothetical protein FF1_021604 [Malus domestica]